MSTSTSTSDDDQLFGAEHVRAYRETDGERGYRWRGTTILLLTTLGRKSGEQRTTPLIYRDHDETDAFVIVASKGGAPEHPGWYENLLAAGGEAEVQVLADTIPVRARDAQGEERTRLWRRMTEVWPDYDAYQEKTEREIPVVVLEPR